MQLRDWIDLGLAWMVAALVLVVVTAIPVFADEIPHELTVANAPFVQGDTLYIVGVLDSAIYSTLAYDYQLPPEKRLMPKVKYVDLNSLGGHGDWTLEAAKKLKELGKITRVRSGSYCASACVYLFAAGKEREAAADVWLGVHGARPSGSYATSFEGLCMEDNDDGTSEYRPKKKGCAAFMAHWYELAAGQTTTAFDFMESNGVLPTLRSTYLGMPDDENWPQELNVLRKPDWILNAPLAIDYNLVTRVIPATAPVPTPTYVPGM